MNVVSGVNSTILQCLPRIGLGNASDEQSSLVGFNMIGLEPKGGFLSTESETETKFALAPFVVLQRAVVHAGVGPS